MIWHRESNNLLEQQKKQIRPALLQTTTKLVFGMTLTYIKQISKFAILSLYIVSSISLFDMKKTGLSLFDCVWCKT